MVGWLFYCLWSHLMMSLRMIPGRSIEKLLSLSKNDHICFELDCPVRGYALEFQEVPKPKICHTQFLIAGAKARGNRIFF